MIRFRACRAVCLGRQGGRRHGRLGPGGPRTRRSVRTEPSHLQVIMIVPILDDK